MHKNKLWWKITALLSISLTSSAACHPNYNQSIRVRSPNGCQLHLTRFHLTVLVHRHLPDIHHILNAALVAKGSICET